MSAGVGVFEIIEMGTGLLRGPVAYIRNFRPYIPSFGLMISGSLYGILILQKSNAMLLYSYWILMGGNYKFILLRGINSNFNKFVIPSHQYPI